MKKLVLWTAVTMTLLVGAFATAKGGKKPAPQPGDPVPVCGIHQLC